MNYITRELTEEEVKKAEKEGVYSLFNKAQICGYGVYGAKIWEDENGKKMLSYSTGSSCD